MISDMINNKNLNPVVTELFIRGREPNILVNYITLPSNDPLRFRKNLFR